MIGMQPKKVVCPGEAGEIEGSQDVGPWQSHKTFALKAIKYLCHHYKKQPPLFLKAYHVHGTVLRALE